MADVLSRGSYQMRLLIGCESSGIVTKAFLSRGHYAISCDFLPCDYDPDRQNHYMGDVRDLFSQHWDIFIASPLYVAARMQALRLQWQSNGVNIAGNNTRV